MTKARIKLDGRTGSRDWGCIVNLMDDGIREDIHNRLAPCSEQEFLDAYERDHVEKFGERLCWV